MKNMKKIVALLVAVLMLMSSFAALAEPQTTPTNNLTQNSPLKVTALEKGDTVYYYKVIEWKDNLGWGFTDQFAGLGSKEVSAILATGEAAPDTRIDSVLRYITGVPAGYTTAANGTVTPDQSKPAIPGKINSKLAGEIAKLAKTPIKPDGESVGSSKEWTAALSNTSDAGLYLVLVAAGQSGYVYNPIFVASNYYNGTAGGKPQKDDKNEWELLVNTDTYSDTAMAKKEKIEVNKKTLDSSDERVTGEIDGLESMEIGGKYYTYDEASTTKIGDVVDFEITTTIPLYAGNYKIDDNDLKFEVSDVMSAGLELSPGEGSGAAMGTVKVYGKTGDTPFAEIPSTNYSITTDKTGNGSTKNVVVSFTSDYIKGLAAPESIKITYKAKVTDSALKNVNTENNTVTVEYSNNPTDNDAVGFLKDVTNNYTFSIDADAFGVTEYETSELVKVGVDKDGNEITEKKPLSNGSSVGALQGAKFTLYTDPGCTAAVGADYTNVESDANGKLNFKGLDVGTYYLKETSAPVGYIASTTTYKIEISAAFKQRAVEETLTDTINGKPYSQAVTYTTKILDNYTVKVSEVENITTGAVKEGTTTTSKYYMTYDSETATENLYAPSGIKLKNTSVKKESDTHRADADNEHKLLNTQGVELPHTGGMGTTILYIGGSILVILAAVLLITKRRMNAED